MCSQSDLIDVPQTPEKFHLAPAALEAAVAAASAASGRSLDGWVSWIRCSASEKNYFFLVWFLGFLVSASEKSYIPFSTVFFDSLI